ncbi:MAG: hypothetical protein ACLUE1_09355 [Adlercreutzia equolifaciens]
MANSELPAQEDAAGNPTIADRAAASTRSPPCRRRLRDSFARVHALDIDFSLKRACT